MTHWNFETGDGNSLCEGYQGMYEHAEVVAQTKANEIGDTVYFYEVGSTEWHEVDPQRPL